MRSLLDAGVPAWRILVVTFSPRVASRIAAHLPADADAGSAGGVWLQTAQRLCVRLLHECYRIRGQGEDVRVLSAFERATFLHAAARRVAAELRYCSWPCPSRAAALVTWTGFAHVGTAVLAALQRYPDPGTLRDHLVAAFVASCRAQGIAEKAIEATYRPRGETMLDVTGREMWLELAPPWQSLAPTLEDVLAAGLHVRLAGYHLARGAVGERPSYKAAERSLVTLDPDTLVDATAHSGHNLFTARSKLLIRPFAPAVRDDRPGLVSAYPLATFSGPGVIDRDRDVLKIDYDLPTNLFGPLFGPLRRVLDELVEVAPGYYLGKAHLRVRSHWRTVAYFAMPGGEP